jgi:hypothetical protein
MKPIKIADPIARTEAVIIESIASQSLALGIAQQEIAALDDRRAALLTSGTLDEIHQIGDLLTRTKLGAEIAQSRIDALNGELRRFYATQARAAIDAAMAPLAGIDAEEREAVLSYEAHAAAVAADLAKLQEFDARRHQVSVAVHRLNGQYLTHSKTYRGSLAQARLPSADGGADHWPATSYAAVLNETHRNALDQAALEEFHRGSE